MPELKIAIGSIQYELSCREEEKETISQIAQKINQKINLLSLEIGRINEKILLLTLLIINTKKLNKIKSKNFEENLLNTLKIIAPLLNTKDDKALEEQLIISNIMKESELMNIGEDLEAEEENEDTINKETHYKEMTELVDNIATYLEKILL